MDLDKKELAQKVSILYYEKGKSQNDIALEIGISRSYVSQLLSYARDIGIVQISINVDEYELRMIRKEVEFKSLFPELEKVYIMASESEDFTLMNLGKFAKPYITDMMQNAKVIGINLGKSVERAIDHLNVENFRNSDDKTIVQIMGGFTNSDSIDSAHPNDLVKRLSNILGCGCYYLNCPAVIDDAKLRSSLMKEKSIASVVKMWDRLDMTIMGLGVADERSKLFSLLSEDMIEEVKATEACTDLTINYVDKDGNYLPLLEDHKISIPFDTLKQVKQKVVICHGEFKKEAILAALKGRLIDILIIDSITADAVEALIK